MGLSEADTRAKLIDPALHAQGWTEDLVRREETAGAIEIIEDNPGKQAKGLVDYILMVRVINDTQLIAMGFIEAKVQDFPSAHGLDQTKLYVPCKRLNNSLVFLINGTKEWMHQAIVACVNQVEDLKRNLANAGRHPG